MLALQTSQVGNMICLFITVLTAFQFLASCTDNRLYTVRITINQAGTPASIIILHCPSVGWKPMTFQLC